MYDEMSFLFSVDPKIRNMNNNAERNQIVDFDNPAQSIKYKQEWDENNEEFYVNKYVVNRGDVKNYIRSDVNKAYKTNGKNPYLDLLEFTNDPNTAKSLKIKSSDLAYLRDIGVFPINRLMILRRYPEGVIVPVDLNDLNVEPISTVIGWVKSDSDMLDYTFNEKWITLGSDSTLDKMLDNIINDSFGVQLSQMLPIPGWGLGFLFGVLNKMELTDYDQTNLPVGDPNVLQEAITRPHDQFGLESGFKFELDTVYEQKYIAGIDPTVSSMDILYNLLMMGTSDTKVIGKKGSPFEKKLRKANERTPDSEGWGEFAGWFVTNFVEALGSTLTENIEDVKQLLIGNKVKNDDDEENATEKEEKKRWQFWKKDESKEKKGKEGDEVDEEGDEVEDAKEKGNFIKNALDSVGKSTLATSILASTLARYRWPIRGSLSMFTGDANTPWHLTIGNPYAPLLSMNNITVDTIQIKEDKELGYNDMPKYKTVKITMNQGRNLGKNEIYELFGVRYKRKYSKTDSYKTK